VAAHELLAYCRAGFESECAQELAASLGAAEHSGHARTARGDALVRYVAGHALARVPAWSELIFARQVLSLVAELATLDPRDRLTPAIEAARAAGLRGADVWVEAPDSEAGAELKGLCRSLEAAAVAAFRRAGLIASGATTRIHLCMTSGTSGLLASVEIARAAPWPMGVPRLKLPREAPSRSALKIEEAWLTLMSEAERARWLAPGLSAVDLGAAPGGWSWQLARRSLRVVAVDNGPLAPQVLATALVEHVRADGFRYRPRRRVDWVVCDMVEQPSRIAALIADWLVQGHARAALFNLKLPMKKRWQETQACLATLRDALGARHALRAKQLYHDREEITVVALPTG
jgi:23S rRNA (cytidine2498-2'-O)-methyltransferase